MPEAVKLPKRRAYVDFQISTPTQEGQNAKRVEGLNVRFSVQKFRGQLQGKARISICNLASSDIEYLTTYMSPWVELQKRKRIQLWAGYEDNFGLLFSGDILKALPTMPPDIWLNCEALGGYYNNLITASFTLQGPITIQAVCETVAQKLGVPFINEASAKVSNIQIDGFCYTGGLTNAVKKINELGLCCVWVENEILYMADNEPEQPKNKGVRLLTEQSGLIGLPEPGPIGLDATMLLDPSIKLGDPIEVRSIRMPSINGVYYPYALEHTGELRGNDWYTKIRCKRFNYA